MRLQFGFKTLALAFSIGLVLGVVLILDKTALSGLFGLERQTPTPQASGTIDVYFCPGDACAQQLIQRIDTANQRIDIAIYSFTHARIADALERAHERGVAIRIVFDNEQAGGAYSVDEQLENIGIPIKKYSPPGRGILHHKVLVIDSAIVATGSFNYSINADEYNRENLVIIADETIARGFENEFDTIWNAA